MEEPTPGAVVDARADRFAQGTLGVGFLACFVFRLPWLVPALGLICAIGALGGPQVHLLHVVFSRAVAPRLPAADGRVAVATVRAQDALLAGLAAIATGAATVFTSLGWLLVIVAGVIAALAATTRVHVGDQLLRLVER